MPEVVSHEDLARFTTRVQEARAARDELALTRRLKVSTLTHDEKLRLAATLSEKKKQRGLRDLYFFCKHILGYSDMSDMHRELCDFTSAVRPSGKYFTRNLILEPRGSFKSSVVTIGYALWRVIKQPNLRVLIDSEEYGKSKAFLRELRGHVEHNDLFRELYGHLDERKYSDVWTDSGFNLSKRTKRTKETNFSCAGIDVTKVGMHYDLIICDDLVSEKNITTPEQIEKVIRHYKLLLSLIDPGCELVVIGTRWHFGDLYGYLLERDRVRVDRGKRARWRKLIRPARYPDGRLLFPERLDNSFLRAQKAEQGSYIFSCQYLNDPAGAEDAAFKKEWFQWFTSLPEGVPLKCAITVDPSVGQRDNSDYTAIVAVAVDPLNNWYVLRVDRGRWNPTQIFDRLVRMRRWVQQKYNLKAKVAMEVVAFQKVLAFYGKDLMRRREIERFSIMELKTDTTISKEMRIRGIVPHIENGKVYFRGKSQRKCSEGIKILVNEMLQFPVGSSKDCIDALAYIPQVLNAPHEQTPRKKEPTIFARILQDAKRRGRLAGGSDLRVGSRILRGEKLPWQ
jgi:phage terminase large subunit-like protein